MDNVARERIGRAIAALALASLASPALLSCHRDVHAAAPAASANPRPRPTLPLPATTTTAVGIPTRPADPATTQSSGKLVIVEDRKAGFHLQYPADAWRPKADPDYVLRLVRAEGNNASSVTFDVPDLPPHLPGMIKLNLIEKGYVDDLKKQHPDLKVEQSADHPVNGAKARLVCLTWKQNGRPHNDVGLLMMRGERVYILSADADSADLPAARAAFDQIASSLHWVK